MQTAEVQRQIKNTPTAAINMEENDCQSCSNV